MDDVEAGPVLELGVLEAEGGVELAVGAGGVVKDAAQDSQHVVVVVEDVVVGSVRAAVAPDEQGVGRVDHDLPHVVVGQERAERAVADEVAQGPLDHVVVEGHGATTVPMLGVPGVDGLDDQALEVSRPVGTAEVEGQPVGPLLGQPLDVGEGRGRHGHRPAPTARPTRRTNRAGSGLASRMQSFDAAVVGEAGRSAPWPGVRVGQDRGHRPAGQDLASSAVRGVVEDGLQAVVVDPVPGQVDERADESMDAGGGPPTDHDDDRGVGQRGPGEGVALFEVERTALGATVQIGRDVRHDERMAPAQDVDDLIGDDGGQGGPFLATAKAAEEVVPGALVRRGRRQVRRWSVAEGLGQFEDAVVARRDAVTEVLVGVEGEVGQQGAGLAGVVGGEGLGHRRRADAGRAGHGDESSERRRIGGGLGPGRTARPPSGVALQHRRQCVMVEVGGQDGIGLESIARGVETGTVDHSQGGSGPTDRIRQYPVDARQSGFDDGQVDRRAGEQCPQLLGGHAGGGVQRQRRPGSPPGDGAWPGGPRPAQRGHAVTDHVAVPTGDRTTVSWPSSTASTRPSTSA